MYIHVPSKQVALLTKTLPILTKLHDEKSYKYHIIHYNYNIIIGGGGGGGRGGGGGGHY